MQEDRGPLTGLRVVDFSRVLSGPYASMLLGDLGADVIKIERPQEGDPSRRNEPTLEGESHYFMSVNRNKRSVTLDLQSEAGRDAALQLCATADVVIENFRPGVMTRHGLDYESVAGINPRVVYCSITGFGDEGPLARAPAYNEVLQAMTGVMSINGQPDGPPTKLGIPIGDIGGGLFAVIGIQAALLRRTQSGKGEWVDVALYDASIGLLGYLAGLYFATGESPVRVGSGHHSVAPLGVFETLDGYVSLSIFTTRFWRNFCQAVGRPELARDPRFTHNAVRIENKRVLDETIQLIMKQETTEHWLAALSEADVPHAEVRSVGEALEHEQTARRRMVEVVDHPVVGSWKVTGRVIKFAGSPPAKMLPPPLLGEHTAEVLSEIAGYGQTEIAAAMGAE